jgi:hypothetical protein
MPFFLVRKTAVIVFCGGSGGNIAENVLKVVKIFFAGHSSLSGNPSYSQLDCRPARVAL